MAAPAPPPPLTFADLTLDALSHVLRFLPLRDVACAARACASLRAAAADEALWARLCADWAAEHCVRGLTLSADANARFDAPAAAASLGLSSCRALRALQHAWGGDPCGVWRLVSADGSGAQEARGGMLIVSVDAATRTLVGTEVPPEANAAAYAGAHALLAAARAASRRPVLRAGRGRVALRCVCRANNNRVFARRHRCCARAHRRR
jgi:hypothetical protein